MQNTSEYTGKLTRKEVSLYTVICDLKVVRIRSSDPKSRRIGIVVWFVA